MTGGTTNEIADQLLGLFPWDGPENSIEGFIRRELAENAAQSVATGELTNIEAAEAEYERAIDAFFAVKSGARNRDPNVSIFGVPFLLHEPLWQHQQNLLSVDPANTRFVFDADELRIATQDYLEQSLRSKHFELTLIDALAAYELHEFWRYSHDKFHLSKKLPRELRPLGPVEVFIKGAGWVAGICGVLAALVYYFLPNWGTIATWVISIVATILMLLVSAIAISLNGQEMSEKRKYQHLLKQLIAGYYALPTDFPLSYREFRRVLEKTTDEGVSWPAAIFAILDDIERRS